MHWEHLVLATGPPGSPSVYIQNMPIVFARHNALPSFALLCFFCYTFFAKENNLLYFFLPNFSLLRIVTETSQAIQNSLSFILAAS